MEELRTGHIVLIGKPENKVFGIVSGTGHGTVFFRFFDVYNDSDRGEVPDSDITNCTREEACAAVESWASKKIARATAEIKAQAAVFANVDLKSR